MVLEAFDEPDGQVTVSAEVWSIRGEMRNEPILNSYRFASTAVATKFVDEAMIALEYLGCHITKRTDDGDE